MKTPISILPSPEKFQSPGSHLSLWKWKVGTWSLTVLFLAAGLARAAYDPGWTKAECDSYSWHGVHERYVFASSKGWIDNDRWDSSTTEGVDCSSYVPRSLAIPEYIGEHVSQGHLYGTISIYPNGLPHADTPISSAMNLESFDFFVWRASAGGPSEGHTGLIKTPGSTCITREAHCTSCGVEQLARSRQSLIDYNCNFWRRNQWGGGKPDRPTSLTATATSWNKIDLKWADNSGNENGFEIQKSSGGSDGPWNSIHNTGANVKSYTVGGLAGNVTYWFRARASNGEGNSDWSNVAHDTTFSQFPPAAPTGLMATANTDDKITLSWSDNSSNEDQFSVQQSTDGVTWTLIKETNPNATSYQVTGLKGNRTYYFRVKAMNEAGSSDWSNMATDTTPPTAPGDLLATAVDQNQIDLSWTDNSGSEAGFKIERAAASGGPWTQIATNTASDAAFSDTGRSATTTYYYRVRAYNANGNSDYSNVDSATTKGFPPVLATIGNKTVLEGQLLTFTATSTDPNHANSSTNWGTFIGYSDGQEDVLFHDPDYANATDQFIDPTATNFTAITRDYPDGHTSLNVLECQWNFKTGQTNPFLQLSTLNTAELPNPTISLSQSLRFDVYSTKDVTLGLGVRETGTNAKVGDDGGATGSWEWVGVTNVVGGSPQATLFVAKSSWTTVTFNLPFEEVSIAPGSGGNGVVEGKGTMNQLLIVPQDSMGKYTLYFDNFIVLTNNTLTFSLGSGAPAGASIHPKTGVFTWTPTAAQGPAVYTITVRVTDQLGLQDSEQIKVTVLDSSGNTPPILSLIGNKTVSEGSTLTFTASATDANVGQTLTFSLDAGAPTGASIHSTNGVFTWTPTENQGPATNSITIRVSDDGSTSLSDSETILVTVREANTAPALSAITDKTVTEGATFNFTPSASDSDVPTNSLTYSLITAPLAITINTNTGRLTWVTAEKDGPDTNQITIRVTDNGSPRLWSQQTFNLIVNEANVAPVLILSNAASATVKLADFENYNDGTFNGTVLFRQPGFSGSTLSFLDTAAADATTVTTNSPGTVRSSVLKASFAFKTNQVNPWLRLTTFNPASLPNPTVDCGKHVKFDLYSSKSIKVCLGIRETGTGAPLGADGGTSGAIEFVGASGKNGNAPIPTRTVAANTWTTLDFDLPNESAAPMTGDGILSPIKGVLENIAIVPNGGSGVHNVYFDNFQVFSSSTNLTVNVGEEISLRCTATDADLPPQTLTFSLDPGAPAGAEISEDGIFNWTPTPAQGPATNVITVRVTDDGSPALTETKNVTIKVLKPNTPPQIAGLEDDIIVENGSGLITFDVTAWDDDLPAQTLTFSLASAPAGASISPGTGAFAWTPPVGLSTNEVTVRVADNGVPPLYVEAVFTLIIVPSNAPPSLSPISDQSVYAGVWLSFIVNATDPDASSQPCFFNVDGPAESGINETNGVFSWRPNQADIGTNSVTVYVTDQPANGGIPKSDSQTFAVIVKAPPAVRLAASGANFVLTWEAISGKTYRVQYKNNLNDSAWLDLSPDITASGESVSIAVPKDTAKRFYRLALIE